jgi:CHASE2 domain-containing sensor protein
VVKCSLITWFRNDERQTLMGILLGLVSLALLTIPLWRIMQRAGFSPWLSLLALVPVVNVIALWLFAFGRWPAVDGDR